MKTLELLHPRLIHLFRIDINLWDFLSDPFPYTALLCANIPLMSYDLYNINWRDPRHLPQEHWINREMISRDLWHLRRIDKIKEMKRDLA